MNNAFSLNTNNIPTNQALKNTTLKHFSNYYNITKHTVSMGELSVMDTSK